MRQTLILSTLVVGSIAVSPYPVKYASPELTCKVYGLAHEFAKVIQPDLTNTQQQAVWDALNLDKCNTTWLEQNDRDDSKSTSIENFAHATGQIGSKFLVFVDPINGVDQAGHGTTEALPVKTLHFARDLARTNPPATIFLRNGTYFLDSTLDLTPEDNGLNIEPFCSSQGQCDKAIISGNVPLPALTWSPYNVTSGMHMTAVPNSNFVYGATQGANSTCFRYAGKTTTAVACSNICLGDSLCTAFTWHDGQQPTGSQSWDSQCYLVAGCAYTSHAQTHHFSGAKVDNRRNIYVATVPAAARATLETHAIRKDKDGRIRGADGMRFSPDQQQRSASSGAPTSFSGLRAGGKRMIRARWPNSDPEYSLFPDGWYGTKVRSHAHATTPATATTTSSPTTTTTALAPATTAAATTTSTASAVSITE